MQPAPGPGATLASVTLDGRDVALLNWYLLAGLEPPAEVVRAASAMVARHRGCRCRWCRSGERDRWAEVLGVDRS